MRIDSQSITGGYVAHNIGNKSNISHKSLLYNPNNMLHKINPVTKFMDDYFQRSVGASRRLWHAAQENIKPYLKIINVGNKKHKDILMWDINKDNRQKYIMVMHGLSHNISSLQDLYSAVINKTDYAVLAPEYYGFTHDNKDFVYIEPKDITTDMDTALKYLTEKGIKEKDICVCGHSFGGFAASAFAKNHPELERLILISAIDTDKHWLDAIEAGHPKGVPERIQKLVKTHKLLTFPLRLIYNTSKCLNKTDVPVDIIHSEQDKRVKINTAIELSKKCKNLSSLNILKNGSHRLDYDKIQAVVEILNANNV